MTRLVVRSAGFSPVKGMRHLEHDVVRLDARGPVGDRAGDQRDGDDREHALEADEDQRRDGEDHRLGIHQRLQPDVVEVAQQAAPDVIAERETVAVQHPEHADES